MKIGNPFGNPFGNRLCVSIVSVLLASCGGGGGDAASGGQLSGSVTLLASAEVATPSSIGAVLPAGASGQPACSLLTGQLPPGMTLTGCTLQGIPTATGLYVSQLSLTIPGYTGSTRVDATVTIAGPALGPSAAPTGTGLRLGYAISGLSVFGFYSEPPFTVRPTDSVVYRIAAGSLPPGLNFDNATGLISGTPTLTGAFPLTVGATLTRGTAVYRLADYATVGVLVVNY